MKIPTLSSVMLALTLLVIIFCLGRFLGTLVHPAPTQEQVPSPIVTYTWSHHGP